MMEIKLYQVNMDRDEQRVAFDSLERLKKFQGTDVPKSEIYDRVFAGEVDTNYLEGVYTIFNTNHPAGYTGRSMSVSDVLEVVSSDDKDIKPGFYFCDSFGFKEVPFEPEKAVAGPYDPDKKIDNIISGARQKVQDPTVSKTPEQER